jgi:hypothetical protein
VKDFLGLYIPVLDSGLFRSPGVYSGAGCGPPAVKIWSAQACCAEGDQLLPDVDLVLAKQASPIEGVPLRGAHSKTKQAIMLQEEIKS